MENHRIIQIAGSGDSDIFFALFDDGNIYKVFTTKLDDPSKRYFWQKVTAIPKE